MKSLKEIKSIIFRTECKQYICEGLCCSEPIMSCDASGIIENYFIYACNSDATTFSRPMVIFGIYSDSENIAYVKTEVDIEDRLFQVNSQQRIDENELFDLYDKYEELYPQIREFAFTDCSSLQKQILSEFYSNLQVISGTVLWDFYRKLFPQFFEWAEKIIL